MYEGKSYTATDAYLENNSASSEFSVRGDAAEESCCVGHRQTFTRRVRRTCIASKWSITFMHASLHACITGPHRHFMYTRRGRIVKPWTTTHHGAHMLARKRVPHSESGHFPRPNFDERFLSSTEVVCEATSSGVVTRRVAAKTYIVHGSLGRKFGTSHI